MATYYVRKTGSDSNAGTSAGAAWLTLAKALGAAGIASGDIVYVGAGVYREVLTVAMTSATGETRIVADVDGAQTGDPGDVVWTAYTTNDTTAPGARPLSLDGRDFLTFENFIFIGGNSTSAIWVDGQTTHSVNIKFKDCTFLPGSSGGATTGIRYTSIADTAANWEFNRCRFMAPGASASNGIITITLVTSASADYDSNFQIKNCVFLQGFGDAAVVVTASGAGSFKGGGVDMDHCTNIGNGGLMRTLSANVATSIPCNVTRSSCWSRGACLNANTSGQITESYNYLVSTTARTNVTAGTGSIADGSYSGLIEIGQDWVTGRAPRPFGTPMASSPLLGFASSVSETVDILNRVRPSGGASLSVAVGALERHDFAEKEVTVTDAGSVAIKLTGPGDQDIQIPVDAASTTITVKTRFDTNHGTGTRPQASLLANGEIGFAGETKTAVGAVDTWETLTFSAFTPSAKGVVTLRFISRPTAAGGIAYFDTLAVA